MANVPKAFYRGWADSSLATVYTVPTNSTAIMTNLVAANNTEDGSQAIAVALDGVFILPASTIPPRGIITLEVSQVLYENGTIQVQATDPNSVSVHISGVEVTP